MTELAAELHDGNREQKAKELVQVSRRISRAGAEIERLRKDLPPGVVLRPFYDQSEIVNDSIKSVRDAIFIGLVLASIILVIFLRDWGTSLVAGLVIPATVAITFIFLRMLGESFDLEHAGHDRTAGKVATQVPGLGIDVVAAHGMLAGHQLDNLVDQQERLPVRNDRLDAVPTERQGERLAHADAASSASTSERRMRARPRWAWHFTVPTGISIASAISS